MLTFFIVAIVGMVSYALGYASGVKKAEELVRKTFWKASQRLSAEAFNELMKDVTPHRKDRL